MTKRFSGFPPEGQYWQFPTIINGFVDILSGNEFKVLWYILRHTYGFQKSADRISISQIMYGIKRKNGTTLDVGTGIKWRKTVVDATKNLERLGFVKLVKKTGKTTLYSPLVRNSHQTSSINELVGGSKNEPTINNITIDNNNNGKTIENIKNHIRTEVLGGPAVSAQTV